MGGAGPWKTWDLTMGGEKVALEAQPAGLSFEVPRKRHGNSLLGAPHALLGLHCAFCLGGAGGSSLRI